MRYQKLESSEIAAALMTLPEWKLSANGLAIERSYRFGSFIEAMSFMNECAHFAERLNHHPDWRNVYSRVHVLLTTHDAQGLTDLDVALATMMEAATTKRRN